GALGPPSGASASGTIPFTSFQQVSAPSTCTTGGTTTGTATVTGNNTYTPSTGFTPTVAGNYWLYASYNGDGNNQAATSACPPGGSQEIVVANAEPTRSASAPSNGAARTAIAGSDVSGALGDTSGADARRRIT